MKKKAVLAVAACLALCAPSAYAQCFGSRCPSGIGRATYQSYGYTRYYYAPTNVTYRSCETATPSPCETVVETPQPCAPCDTVAEPEPCEPVTTYAPSCETIERISKEVDECLGGGCPIRAASRVAVRTATAPVRVVASLLDSANRTRARYGLPALSYDPTLEAGARYQAQHCARVGFLQHGYGAAEILAQNDQGIETAVNQWLTSERHRALLLSGKYRYAGVAVVRDSQGRAWCAMRFR